jgi:hypothetical protein
MVMDVPKRETLTKFDWTILGHSYDPETPVLPRRRIDVPFGPTAGDMHVVANKLVMLAEALRSAARSHERLGTEQRTVILEGMQQVRLTHQALREIKRDWERELRIAHSGALKGKEHLREVG